MKTESNGRGIVAKSEIAARVCELAPTFLEGLTPDELAEVLGAGTLKRIPADSLIAIEGHSADKLFLIIEGRARTFTTTRRGEKVVVIWIPPGECSGGRALLYKPSNYLLSTETVSDCLVLVWRRRTIATLVRRYPRLLGNALQIASRYVEIYRDLHDGVIHLPAQERVAQLLYSLAKEIGRQCDGGTIIDISNEELANQGSVTIFTVSRILSDWRRRGLLTKGRGRIIVLSPEDLLRCVGRDSAFFE
jgi:CRP/FNR family transcriptional regulator, nitrogen oxide reductase regulator